MNVQGFESSRFGNDRRSRFAFSVFKAAMSLPGARVDRQSFLRDQFRPHCPEEQVKEAIDTSPAQAGVRGRTIERIVNSVINSHVRQAAGLSFVAGLPGGLIGLAAIPADTTQFLWHSIVLAQKLAYLYGWPDLAQEGEPDEETQNRIVVLLGSMFGVDQANNALKVAAQRFAEEVGTRVPKQALTKTIYYPALKKTLKWFGIKLTKQSFAKGAARIVPFIGGGLAAGMTTITLRPMAHNLKNHLKELRYAKGPCCEPPSSADNLLAVRG